MEVDSLSPPAMSESSVEIQDLLVPAKQFVSYEIARATFLSIPLTSLVFNSLSRSLALPERLQPRKPLDLYDPI